MTILEASFIILAANKLGGFQIIVTFDLFARRVRGLDDSAPCWDRVALIVVSIAVGVVAGRTIDRTAG